MTAHKTGDGGWNFDMSLPRVAIPAVPISDNYKSSALEHGSLLVDLAARNQPRQQEGHEKTRVRSEEQSGTAAQTHGPGRRRQERVRHSHLRGAMRSTFQYLARREMGQGRVPPAGKVFFGSGYDVKMVYTGAQDIPVAGKPTVTDHLNVSVKGPASDFSVRNFLRARCSPHAAADQNSGHGRHGFVGTGA